MGKRTNRRQTTWWKGFLESVAGCNSIQTPQRPISGAQLSTAIDLNAAAFFVLLCHHAFLTPVPALLPLPEERYIVRSAGFSRCKECSTRPCFWRALESRAPALPFSDRQGRSAAPVIHPVQHRVGRGCHPERESYLQDIKCVGSFTEEDVVSSATKVSHNLWTSGLPSMRSRQQQGDAAQALYTTAHSSLAPKAGMRCGHGFVLIHFEQNLSTGCVV